MEKRWEVGVERWEVGVERWEVGVERWEVGVERWEVGVERCEIGVKRSEVGVERSEVGVERSEVGVERSEVGVESCDTCDHKVTAANVERLLPTADHFHVLGLVKQCCDFLNKHLDCDNCIGIRNFAHAYNCAQLESNANKFILER